MIYTLTTYNIMERQPTGYLTPTGFYAITNEIKKGLGIERYEKLLNKLTIVYKGKVGLPKRTMLYRHDNHKIYLPRTVMPTLLSAGIIKRVVVSIPPVARVEIPLVKDLYVDQITVIDYLMENVFTDQRMIRGKATCVFNLRAGQGKTFVAAGVISALGLPTLYIAPTQYLGEQAVKDLCTVLGAGVAVEYGTSAKSKAAQERAHVVVIVINSAITRDDEFYRRFGLIVMDEVHMYCSDVRMSIFSRCAWAVLGLSATTAGLTKGRDPVLKFHLAHDDIIHAENIPGFEYKEETKFTCVANVIKYKGPASHTQFLTHESTGMMFTHYMHEQFLDDTYRLRLAVFELIKLFDWRGSQGQRHRIYVFAEEIKLLRAAKSAFEEILSWCGRADIIAAIKVEDVDVNTSHTPTPTGMFTGGTKINDVNDTVVLFATYGFAGQGISIIEMTAMLLLTSRRSNFMQIFARILRRGSDMSIPRIVTDIVDASTAMRGQATARVPVYNYYGFEINTTTVHYDSISAQPVLSRLIDAYAYIYMYMNHVHADVATIIMHKIIRSCIG